MRLSSLDAANPEVLRTVAGLWNAACGQGLSISERLVQFNLAAANGTVVAGCLAEWQGQPAGFVSVCATTGPVEGLVHPGAWIDALVVTPSLQRRGVGSRLLSWAENWFLERGCPAVRLGGGPRPFVPGLPVRTGSADFFLKRGYAPRPADAHVWDVARSLESYTTPDFVNPLPVPIRPLRTGETARLDEFLAREFPGRWRYEFQEHLRLGGRLADYLALWGQSGIEGFCQITLEDSLRPIERFYLHGLPRPWGHLGPIGVSAAIRGQGMGSALLDSGLRHLRSEGVAGCVIDWIELLAFYRKFGFQPHHEYIILRKELDGNA